MSVHRLAKYQADDPFTRIPNSAIADPNLDLKALGLLVLMLSKPDGWTFRERNLAESAGVGRDGLRSAMQKLIAAGYVRRTRVSDNGRPPVSVTEVYDTPIHAGVGKTDFGKSDRGEIRPISNEGLSVTNEGSKAKRLTMIRPDWTPDPAVLEQLTVKYPRLNLTDELEAFRDYWTAKGDRRADWNASLRTWCRNADRWAKQQTAKQSRDVPHSRPVKTGPDQCPECAQRWDDHDPQVHELLRGRI